MSSHRMGPLQAGLPYRRQQYSYDEEYRHDSPYDYETDLIGVAAKPWSTPYGEHGQAPESCIYDSYGGGLGEVSWRDICFEARLEADRKRGIYPTANDETSELKEWLLADIMTTKRYHGILGFGRELQWRRAEASPTQIAPQTQGGRRTRFYEPTNDQGNASETFAQGRRTRLHEPATEPGNASRLFYAADNERKYGLRGPMWSMQTQPSYYR